MASVIKAGKVIRGGNSVQPTEFNLEDVSQQASAYLDTVRKQAEQILTQAHQQAKQIVTQAAQEGRQAAEAAARDAALKEFENRWQTLAPALNQAIEGTSQLKASWLKQWENNAVHLVVAVAQRVIRTELTHQPELPQTWLRETLELASGAGAITLHLHPDDYTALASHRESLTQQFGQLAEANIVADPAVTPGGCRVVTEHGMIDAQIETQLARIEQELTT